MIADRLVPLWSVVLVAVGTGCAGARSNVTADDAKYPISLSRAVRDSDGETVAQDRAKKVGSFKHEGSTGAIFYSLLGPSKTDISKAVNQAVAAHGADAVINLRVAVDQCALNWAPIVFLLPIWPGCAHIAVEGDIIKVAPKPVTVATIVATTNVVKP